MSLYLVTLSVDVVVQADSVKDARDAAIEAGRHEVGTYGDSAFSPESETLVTRLGQVPEDWRDGQPYGGDGTRTVREILGGES